MINASAEVKSAELSVVVIRADGSKEDLGVVARYDSTPTSKVKACLTQLITKFETLKHQWLAQKGN